MTSHSHVDRHRQTALEARRQIIAAVDEVLDVLDHEDPASPVGPSFDPGGGTAAHTPTEAAALGGKVLALQADDHGGGETYDHRHDDPRRHLARITSRLQQHAVDLRDFAASLTATRTPSKPCWCCRDPENLATHRTSITLERGGIERTVGVEVCVPCLDYQRAHGYPCDDDVHAQRPRVRWCDCPPECCDVCPDKAAEGRSVSERCKSRMRPDRRGNR